MEFNYLLELIGTASDLMVLCFPRKLGQKELSQQKENLLVNQIVKAEDSQTRIMPHLAQI